MAERQTIDELHEFEDDELDELEEEEEEEEDDDESDEDDGDDDSDDGDDDSDEDDDDSDDEDDDEKDGFQGKFDPKRARATINRLRRENRQLKKNRGGKADSAETVALRKENLQLKVAHKLGIPTKLATRLNGEDEAEMIEDASELLDELGLSSDDDDGKPKKRQPKPRLRGGSRPNQDAEESAEDIVKKALGR